MNLVERNTIIELSTLDVSYSLQNWFFVFSLFIHGLLAGIYTASANITPATRDHLHCGSVQIWRAACRYGTQLHAHYFGTFITHKNTEYDWQSTTRHKVCQCTLTLTLIHPLSCFVNLYFLEFLSPSVVSLSLSLSLSLSSFHC